MIISNEEFETARKNQDNINVLRFMGNVFANKLDKTTIQSCGDLALWKCMLKYDKNKGLKFTSSLCNYMKWECLSEIKFLDRHKTEELDGKDMAKSDKLGGNDILSLLPSQEQNIIKDRFFEGRSMKELSKKYGYSRQWIRQIINRAFSRIKSTYGV